MNQRVKLDKSAQPLELKTIALQEVGLKEPDHENTQPENLAHALTAPEPLSDKFGRRFSYLRLSVTEACNFRCNYCLPDGYCPSTKEAALSLQEIERVIAGMAQLGTRKVRITGGEPTLRKDLPEIIAACANTPQIEKVALTSNGYRLVHQLHSLKEAGLQRLNLSADSLDPTTFNTITGHDKLEQVLQALELSLELGLETKLNVVLMREYNARELNNFVAFVKHRPVSLRLIELMRTNDNTAFYHNQHLSAQALHERLLSEGWQQQARGPHAGPAIELTHPDYAGSIGLIMPYSNNFCADCNRLRIAANGNLHLCLFNRADSNIRRFLQTQDQTGLIQHLQAIAQGKWQGHQLEQGYSGSTQQLAMLGG